MSKQGPDLTRLGTNKWKRTSSIDPKLAKQQSTVKSTAEYLEFFNNNLTQAELN